MSALARIGALLLGLLLASCTTLRTGPSGQAATPDGAGDSQILVMLREAPTPRYRPGEHYATAYDHDAPVWQRALAQRVADDYGLRLMGDWLMPAIGVRCFVAQGRRGPVSDEVLRRLGADARVESTQRVRDFHTLKHSDPYYDLQSAAKSLKLDQLHRLSTGRGILIAQVDTGTELRHPDLQGQWAQARNFVDDGPFPAEHHGTEVAGIMVARADNGLGIVGTAPDARLMPLRACWERPQRGTLCNSFTLAKAIAYALNQPVRILNLSLAGPPDRLLARLLEKALEQGVTVVAAVDPEMPDGSFPASLPGVIAVAVAADGGGASRTPALGAPGEHLLTTTASSTWRFVSGSSFATAHVSGVVALMLQLNPSLRPDRVAALLRQSARGNGPRPSMDACAVLVQLSPRPCTACCAEPAAATDHVPASPRTS